MDRQTDGRTNRHDFGILIIWKHIGTQKISAQSSKLEVSCRSQYAFPDDGDAQKQCIITFWRVQTVFAGCNGNSFDGCNEQFSMTQERETPPRAEQEEFIDPHENFLARPR